MISHLAYILLTAPLGRIPANFCLRECVDCRDISMLLNPPSSGSVEGARLDVDDIVPAFLCSVGANNRVVKVMFKNI